MVGGSNPNPEREGGEDRFRHGGRTPHRREMSGTKAKKTRKTSTKGGSARGEDVKKEKLAWGQEGKRGLYSKNNLPGKGQIY